MDRPRIKLALSVNERNLRRRLAAELKRAMREVAGRPMGFDGCVIFHANIHRDVTGVDPIEHWRGRYTTPRGMRRIMGEGGIPSCMRQAARIMGWNRIKPNTAKVGDVGLVITPTGFAVVRKLHRDDWIGRNESGWSMRRTADVGLAWNIAASL
jgi:hypothetical protein